MRTIVVCCDGTANQIRTNAAQVYRSVEHAESTRLPTYYSPYPALWTRWLVPALGVRLRTVSAYEFLATHFEPGDRVFLFGSGAGAFVVHVLAAMVSACGLVHREHRLLSEQAYDVFDRPEAVDFAKQYTQGCVPQFIGLFDATVPYRLTDLRVERWVPSAIPCACHAVSLDDDAPFRRPFLWKESRGPSQTVEQVWFPGRHSDLVGLSSAKGLSDCALKWMLEKAASQGLPLRSGWEADVHPQPTDPAAGAEDAQWLLRAMFGPRIRTVPDGALVHQSVEERTDGVSTYLPLNFPARRVVVPWHADQSVDVLRTESELEAIRDELKDKPGEEKLWQKLADRLRALNRDDEYLKALDRLTKLREQSAFAANVKQEIRATSMEIRDLDFFGSFQWTLTPRINVLLGKNGYGKSHLLTLMIALLQNAKQHADAFITDKSRRAATAELQVAKGTEMQQVRFTKVGFEANALGKVPVLAISELRFIDKSRGDFGKEDVGDDEDFKAHGADRFLARRPLGPIVQEFLFKLCMQSISRDTLDLPIVKLYHDVVRKLTSSEFRVSSITPVGTSARYRIEVLTEGNNDPVLLQQASQGTLSIMAIVGLIFDFLTSLFPDVAEDTRHLRPAIVVIDELDAHLHPSWQRKILGILRSTFPHVQFIVAAHSPLVVAGCKRGEVAVLRRSAESAGFQLEQLDRHFLGATTSELYNLLFEIEEKDDTYLHYAAMYPFREEIQREANTLESRKALPQIEQTEYAELLARKSTLAHQRSLGESLLRRPTRQNREKQMLIEILRGADLDAADPSTITPAMLQERLSLAPADADRLQALEARQRLPPEEEARLDHLREDLYYLSEFERIEADRAQRRRQESSAQLDLEDQLFQSTGETTKNG